MFDFLPEVDYKIDDKTLRMSNICISTLLKRVNVDKTFLYQEIRINATETLESLSDRLYGTTEFWWVIMLVNSIVNPFSGMVMDTDLLVAYSKKKYGDAYRLHHFINARTNLILDDLLTKKYTKMYEAGEKIPEYIVPVSNVDHESNLNEARTIIRVINPRYVSDFVSIYKGLMDD